MPYSKEELINEIHRLADGNEPPSLSDLSERGKYSSSPYYNQFSSWGAALEEAGYERSRPGNPDPPNRVSKEDLLAEIRRLADGDKPPSTSIMNESGDYSVTTYQNRFSSWAEAVKEAGYTPRGRYSDEELLKEIHRLAESSNPPSLNTDVNERGEMSPMVFINHFGSWNEALREAGYEPRKPYTREELIEEIHRLADGETPPTGSQMRSEGKYSKTIYRDRFGSWNEALREAGYEPNERQNIPKDELVDEIQRIGNKKVPPTLFEVAQGKFSKSTYLSRFDSWQEAVREAGYDDTTTRINYSDKTLLEEIQRLEKNGAPPTQYRMTQSGKFPLNRYINRWGTWNKAIKAAGYKPNSEQNLKKDRLIKALKQLANDLGHLPRVHEVDEYGEHPVRTYERKFGSWWAAQIEAGFRPRRMYPLTPEAFQKLFETTISDRHYQPNYTLLTLLFQFTGISATAAAALSSDMIYDLKGDVGIRIPSKYTDKNSQWEFLIPETWNDPVSGEERPTHLPSLLLWYFNEYNEMFEGSNRTSTHAVIYREALAAGLLDQRQTTEVNGTNVPKVTPVDLRFTHGIHLRANGAPNQYINERLGFNQHGTYITTNKIDFWISQNQNLY